MVLKPPVVNGLGIPGRGNNRTVAHLFAGLFQAAPLLNPVGAEGVSQIVGVDGRGNTEFVANLFEGVFHVGSRHRNPTHPATEEEVRPARASRQHRDEAPVIYPELQIGAAGPADSYKTLLFALGVADKDAPLFQVDILQMNAHGLVYPEAGIQNKAVQGQVTNFAPALITIPFLTFRQHLLDFLLQIAHKSLDLFSRRRSWKLFGLRWWGYLLQGVIADNPSFNQEPDKAPDHGPIAENGTILIIRLTPADEPYDTLRRRGPVRANGPVMLKGLPVMSLGVPGQESLTEQEALYGSFQRVRLLGHTKSFDKAKFGRHRSPILLVRCG